MHYNIEILIVWISTSIWESLVHNWECAGIYESQKIGAGDSLIPTFYIFRAHVPERNQFFSLFDLIWISL